MFILDVYKSKMRTSSCLDNLIWWGVLDVLSIFNWLESRPTSQHSGYKEASFKIAIFMTAQ